MIKVGDKFRIIDPQATQLNGFFNKSHVLTVTRVGLDRVFFKNTVTRTNTELYCLKRCLELVKPSYSHDNKEIEFLNRLHYNRFIL